MLKNKSFVFVTGHPRSGTTFAGKVIASPKDVQYLSEPFNPTFGHKYVNRYFIYTNKNSIDSISQEARDVIDNFLDGKARFRRLNISESKTLKQRIGRFIFGNKNSAEFLNFKYNPFVNTGLIKDPTMVLATNYLLYKNIPTLFLIRHPAATVASCKRLGMKHNVRILKDQPELKPLVEEYENTFDLNKFNNIQHNALHWLFINKLVLSKDILKNKNFLLKTHEDLSTDPINNFQEIFHHFELEYSDVTKSRIIELTSNKNPTLAPENSMHYLNRNSKGNLRAYKKILTKKEISQIREITGNYAKTFYGNDTWA